MRNVDREIANHSERYSDHWQDRGNLYWGWRMAQEWVELIGSLLGIHRHPPEYELKQISGIARNWIRKLRRSRRGEWYELDS